MRASTTFLRLLVASLVVCASREASARSDAGADLGPPSMVERPAEIELGHELGLTELTLHRHALGSYGTTVVSYPDSATEAPLLRGELLLGGGPAVQRHSEAIELPVGVGFCLGLQPRIDLNGDIVARAALHPDATDAGGEALSLDWFAWLGVAVHL